MYDDLVKRLRAAAIMSEALSIFLHHSEGSAVAKLYNEAADAIENQRVIIRSPKAVLDQAPHWIPSEDCLPVNGEEVITLGPNGGMECGFYRGLCGTKRDKWEWKKHTVRTVKYWMPRKALPEPPKEE